MKKIFACLLLLALLLSSCAQQIAPAEEPAATTAEALQTEEKGLTPEEEKILAERRALAADYMHQMATVLWRSAEDVDYTIKSDVSPDQVENTGSLPDKLTLQKGRLYQGLPYTYASNGITSFTDWAAETDDKGVVTVSGLTWQMLSGGAKTARLGNDCATAVMQSWSLLGSSFTITSTANMCAANGFLPVGSYLVSRTKLENTKKDCQNNGEAKMCESYAQLQKADAVVERNGGSGHAMMVTSVHAVPMGDSFHPEQSYITVTHQTRSYYSKGAKFYSDELGEEVYRWYGIDDKYTFRQLYESGYLPITCKELIDPAPLPEVTVTSSLTALTAENMLTGTVTSSHMMECITAEIKNEAGEILQSASTSPTRKERYEFPCEILTDGEKCRGKLDPSALPQGSYTFTLTVTTTGGKEFTPREVSFTK